MQEGNKSKNDSCVSNAKVSVVIPVYNAEKWIVNCIDSVLNQTLPPSEIIVINDGSKDRSTEIIRGKYSFVDSLKMVNQSNKGLAAARNRGIIESIEQFIAFLDADDIWLPDKLNRQMQLLESASDEYGMCHTFFEEIDGDGKILTTWKDIKQRDGYFKYYTEVNSNVLAHKNCVTGSGSSALIRKSCIDKIGFFDEDLRASEDWNYWYRLCLHYRILTVPEVLVQIRCHQYSMQKRRKFILKEELVSIRKLENICLLEHHEILKKTEQRTAATLLLFSLTDVSLVLELFKGYGFLLIPASLKKIVTWTKNRLLWFINRTLLR